MLATVHVRMAEEPSFVRMSISVVSRKGSGSPCVTQAKGKDSRAKVVNAFFCLYLLYYIFILQMFMRAEKISILPTIDNHRSIVYSESEAVLFHEYLCHQLLP